MHKSFGEWYRLVSIEPEAEALKRRWAGVEEWVATIRDNDEALLETVRIFHGLPEKTSREDFLTAFRKHDAAFAQRNNELEQRLLAGAALVCCVGPRDEDEDHLRAAIVAGTAMEASRLRAVDESLEELSAEVVAGLHQIAARKRRRRGGVNTTLLNQKEQGDVAKGIETPTGDHAQLQASIAGVFRTILKAVQRTEHALTAAAHDLRCADEETNILWWLAGGTSRDLDRPWTTLGDAAPLVAAWELADLTDVALGPQDAAALLERTCREAKGKSKEKEQPLQVYVNAVPDEWARRRTAKLDERALDLAPLSLALSHRSSGNTSTWPPFFESVVGVKASMPLTAERAASLAYIEAVLFQALADEDS